MVVVVTSASAVIQIESRFIVAIQLVWGEREGGERGKSARRRLNGTRQASAKTKVERGRKQFKKFKWKLLKVITQLTFDFAELLRGIA